MRWLMWFSIGFAAACGLGVLLAQTIWVLPFAVLFGILSTVCAVLGRRTKGYLAAAAVLLGCTAGLLRYFLFDLYTLVPARTQDGLTVSGEVEILDYGYETDFGVAAEGRILLNGKYYKIRVYLEDQQLLPGDRIQGEFRLRYTAAGGQSSPTHHPGEGVFFLGYGKENCSLLRSEDIPLRVYPAIFRQKISVLLEKAFPTDTYAFAKALLLGDTSELDYPTDTALKVSGIRHVVAVSGLHVSILFGLVYHLFGRRRWITALIGFPVLLLFAAVAGFTPSVNRAAIMQFLLILALLVDKEYDPPTALGFSILLMLFVNPYAVTSVSLQLSAGCMVGIFLFSEKIHNYLLDEKRLGPAKGKTVKAHLLRWLASSISVSISALFITVPLSAYYFGTVSIVGVLTNLLTVWVITFVFYGIMLACLSAAVFAPLGRIVAYVVSWPIRYVLTMAKLLSKLPMAAVYTCSAYIVIWLVFAYAVLGISFLLRKKHPMLACASILAGLVLATSLSHLETRVDPLRVTVLDVGQGQCILLRTEDGTYMVDCGGDYDELAADTAAQMILSQGIRQLDGLILTHYDRDHAGGAPLLLSRIGVDALYLPDIQDEGGIRDALAVKYADRIQWVQEDRSFSSGDTEITLYIANSLEDSNESGICVLFRGENCDILITGDYSSKRERELLENNTLPDLELLIVGHHGSANATCMELLAATNPEYAVISVGRNNSYGHPTEEVLKRLYLHGCEIYRTDLDGTVVFRR